MRDAQPLVLASTMKGTAISGDLEVQRWADQRLHPGGAMSAARNFILKTRCSNTSLGGPQNSKPDYLPREGPHYGLHTEHL